MSNAAHVRAMGWEVGTILDGTPIEDPSVGREPGKQRVITAIGQNAVIVRDRTIMPDGSYGVWGTERLGTFDARSWFPVNTCGRCQECVGLVLSTKTYPENLQWPFIICVECGNKRCPKATDHNLTCTRSNAPGQDGSSYS